LVKKLKKDVLGFTTAGVTLGIGSAITAKAGGSGAGLAAVGGMMPIAGTAMMGGHALRLTKKIYKKKKRY